MLGTDDRAEMDARWRQPDRAAPPGNRGGRSGIELT